MQQVVIEKAGLGTGKLLVPNPLVVLALLHEAKRHLVCQQEGRTVVAPNQHLPDGFLAGLPVVRIGSIKIAISLFEKNIGHLQELVQIYLVVLAVDDRQPHAAESQSFPLVHLTLLRTSVMIRCITSSSCALAIVTAQDSTTSPTWTKRLPNTLAISFMSSLKGWSS